MFRAILRYQPGLCETLSKKKKPTTTKLKCYHLVFIVCPDNSGDSELSTDCVQGSFLNAVYSLVIH